MRLENRGRPRRALIEGLREAIATFAYLDVRIRSGRVRDWEDTWIFCTQVVCDRGAEQGSLMLLASKALAFASATHFLGVPEPPPHLQSDLVGELTNVLAGQAFELTIPGRRPHSISTPRKIDPGAARQCWRLALAKSRLTVCDETATLGGLILVPGIARERFSF